MPRSSSVDRLETPAILAARGMLSAIMGAKSGRREVGTSIFLESNGSLYAFGTGRTMGIGPRGEFRREIREIVVRVSGTMVMHAPTLGLSDATMGRWYS